MFQDTYYVDKSSGTFADALEAFGAATVLREIVRHAQGPASEVRLLDLGAAYAVRLPTAMHEAWLETCPPASLAPFLLTPKNRAKLPEQLPIGTASVVEYEAEKERRGEYLELVRGLSAEAKRARARGDDHPQLQALQGKGVHEHWDIIRALNPAALDAYNNVVGQWWEARAAFPALLRALLRLLAAAPNDLTGAEDEWARACQARGLPKPREATAAQVFNPAQGKGQNRAKADGVAMGNMKGFWLPEYLKAVGMYQAGLTRIVANPRDPRNAKDRKTYVLAPHEVVLGEHEAIMKDFRRTMAGTYTAVKLDVLAALRYTGAFLRHAAESHLPDEAEDLFGKKPSDLISGLQMAFYKNLGNSAATMNIAMMNFPAWVRAGPPMEMALLQAVLDEHERIVRNLDEAHNDAYDLLVVYRDFLSGNDLRRFFEFATAYSGFCMGERERGRYCPPFTTTGLEVLLMNTDKELAKIVQSEGFQNIAYAIRYSTVIPQARKAQGKSGYTVRYGLGQQLARKAAYAADFVAELGEFLQQYNAENEQHFERTGKRFRRGVRTSDIEEVVRLIDEYGPRVVCNLLVAFGYARTPREADKGEEAPEEVVEEAGAGDEVDASEEQG